MQTENEIQIDIEERSRAAFEMVAMAASAGALLRSVRPLEGCRRTLRRPSPSSSTWIPVTAA